MFPKEHVIFGFIFSVILHFIAFPTVGFIAILLVFLASVFIDVDHYLLYVYRRRDLSLHRAYKYFLKKTNSPVMIFHTIEFVVLLLLLAYFNIYFLFIILGILFHWSLDIYYMHRNKVLHERNYSLIHYFLTKD